MVKGAVCPYPEQKVYVRIIIFCWRYKKDVPTHDIVSDQMRYWSCSAMKWSLLMAYVQNMRAYAACHLFNSCGNQKVSVLHPNCDCSIFVNHGNWLSRKFLTVRTTWTYKKRSIVRASMGIVANNTHSIVSCGDASMGRVPFSWLLCNCLTRLVGTRKIIRRLDQ